MTRGGNRLIRKWLCPRRTGRGRGTVLVYTVVSMIALIAICSLAVDLGHVQMVKNEMGSCADATARAYMNYYNLYGQSYADSNGPQFYATAYNPVDGNSGVAPTVTVQWGFWNTTTNSFKTGNASPPAVKVTVSRTAANGNAVSLIWGKLFGQSACDLSVTSVAALMGGQNIDVNIPGTASPYLAGMPAGTSTIYGDNTTNAAPYQVPSISVVPGTWVTLTNLSGQTCVLPGYVAPAGPAGNPSIAVHHGQNWSGNPNTPGPENGIGDAVMPESSFMGVFLSDNAPNLITAPATIDWTQPSVLNQPTYTSIQLQQPFYIGNGATTDGTVQKFLVPPGATRLFLGVWDGVGYFNNAGSLGGTVTVQPFVQLVQ